MTGKYFRTFLIIISIIAVCLLLNSCSDYTTYHLKTWQGAFFINDTTLGVVGWEWDTDVPSSPYDEEKFYNVNQYFLKYYINSQKLEKVYTLQSDCLRNLSYHFLTFEYPILYYSTFTSSLETGIFNIETFENKLLRDNGNYPSTGKPYIVSNNGKYLGFKYAGTEFDWGIWDTVEEKIIFSSFTKRPLFIDDSLKKVIIIEPDNTEKWLLLYDLITTQIDTLGENIFGSFRYVTNNAITVFKKSKSDTLKFFKNKELIKGEFVPYMLPNLSFTYSGTFDINLNDSLCVHGDKMTNDIFLTDFSTGGSTLTILLWSKKET